MYVWVYSYIILNLLRIFNFALLTSNLAHLCTLYKYSTSMYVYVRVLEIDYTEYLYYSETTLDWTLH